MIRLPTAVLALLISSCVSTKQLLPPLAFTNIQEDPDCTVPEPKDAACRLKWQDEAPLPEYYEVRLSDGHVCGRLSKWYTIRVRDGSQVAHGPRQWINPYRFSGPCAPGAPGSSIDYFVFKCPSEGNCGDGVQYTLIAVPYMTCNPTGCTGP